MGKRLIPCKVDDEYLRGAGQLAGAAGSHDDVYLRIYFGGMWSGLSRYVTFKDALGENAIRVWLLPSLMVEDLEDVYDVPIPHSAKAVQGNMMVTITGYGTSEDGTEEENATNTVTAYFKVLEADAAGADDESITLTLAQQVVANMDAISAAEAVRVQNEGERVTAEEARTTAETARAQAESQRASAEAERSTAEDERRLNEDARKVAEEGRASAETERVTKETGRASAELARTQAEAERVAAERARADENTGIVARATEQADRAAESETAAKDAKAEAERSAEEAARCARSAAQSAEGIGTLAKDAEESKDAAGEAATLAESYAKGGTGSRPGEDTDNAKYYMEQAREISGGDFVTRTEFEKEVATVSKATIQQIVDGTYQPGDG